MKTLPFKYPMLICGLILLATILFHSCESKEYSELEEILSLTSVPGEMVSEGDLTSLPDLLKKHLEFAGVVGTPRHYNLKMKGTGKFKQAEKDQWNDLEHVFYLTYKPVSRFWFGDIKTPVGKMSGFDYYRDGQGRLSIRYVPSVCFQEANDEKTAVSELITFMSEHIYNPAAFLNNYFEWLGSTDSTVTARLTDAGISVIGTFFFNEEGCIVKFASDERYLGGGLEARKTTWVVNLGEYKEFDGLLIPTWFKATWYKESGIHEYIHGNINHFRFDTNEL